MNPLDPRPTAKAFPIPVVAAVGPGSQPEDDTLDYLVMPRGMDTFRPPVLPEPEQFSGHGAALTALHAALAALQGAPMRSANAVIELTDLRDADRRLLNQVLGEGEVSAQLFDADGDARVRIQESVFAGLWRVLERAAGGSWRDSLEVGAVPACIGATAHDDGRAGVPPFTAPPGVMNSPALLQELADQRRSWQPGQRAHVINLSLLPLAPDDRTHLDAALGHGSVVVLSRGYGNCRVSSTRVPRTWRVVYYNSQDAVILDSIEVGGVPEVACAAPEDLADSAERLQEVLAWVEQS